jgi:hypothetical protein
MFGRYGPAAAARWQAVDGLLPCRAVAPVALLAGCIMRRVHLPRYEFRLVPLSAMRQQPHGVSVVD